MARCERHSRTTLPIQTDGRKERYEMQANMREAIARVCQGLGLPLGDSFSQDWAYELPEEFRTREFSERYLVLNVANDLLERKDGRKRSPRQERPNEQPVRLRGLSQPLVALCSDVWIHQE